MSSDENVIHKPVYIPSIEACDLYSHMYRDKEIKFKYIGMIPSSLELNKLIDVGLKTKKDKISEKFLSSDVINVKFKQKVRSGEYIKHKVEQKKTELKNKNEEYIHKLDDFISALENEKKLEKWSPLSCKDLRKKFYVDGFEYNGVKYVVYKRSSAKSRIGQCLFIKEKLYDKMIRWSRMGINFQNKKYNGLIDYPSLLAYESLVGSSIEHIINIDPDNILLVDDVESIFEMDTNVVRTDEETGYLNSFREKSKIKNSLFDGESLLDSRYFSEGKSMMLLRNHMFKSAAFNCNIQSFLQDHCPNNVSYDQWELPSIFDGEAIYAKDVHLIITPSSLKALKFSGIFKDKKDMWNHWKSIVRMDGNQFGVCKNEKKSKYGLNKNGKVIQQLSYQMLNSLPVSQGLVSEITGFEKEFIHNLKNDDEFFISYIKETANEMNSNLMFADLYETNRDIAKTELFKNMRKKNVNNHVTHVKNGKVRLSGDYCVMLGNGIEFLFNAIGKLDRTNPVSVSLKGNEIYTELFDEKEVVGFRNPHTSPSNILVVNNKRKNEIARYFNLTKNIVCVNSIGFPIQDILSGCDYDSDSVLLIDDNHLLKVAKEIEGTYLVCKNDVKSSKKKHAVCNEDMAEIDDELSKSQKFIGRTVNTGQLCMSRYWDLINNGIAKKDLADLLKKIDVVTVLSGICIDLAKKMFEIDIEKEIKYIAKTKELKSSKPLFWKYVSQVEVKHSEEYRCPMDFLYKVMDSLGNADHRETVDFEDLLLKRKLNQSFRDQEKKVFDYVEKMNMKIQKVFLSDLTDEERNTEIDNIIKYYQYHIKKLQINEDTMHSIITKVFKNNKKNIATRLLDVLYRCHKDVFLGAFLSKNNTDF